MDQLLAHGIKHSRSQMLIDYACRYAQAAHGDQKRKYTGEPYITHPIAVARIVADVTDDCEMIAAAFLHDVIEDTHVTPEDLIRDGFGGGVARLVVQLTNVSKPSDGNRKIRKALDRGALAYVPPRAKTIKLADLIHNSESIVQYDPAFAKVYMAEKVELLRVLKDGDARLYKKAEGIVRKYYEDHEDEVLNRG